MTERNQTGKRLGKPTRPTTSAGAKILAGLAEVVDVLEAGLPLEERFTVRKVRRLPGPRQLGPDDVKRARAAVGASQATFAQLIGVSPSTVRSWEQGTRPPSPIACRFMDEIAATPEHWRARLRAAVVERGVGS